MLPEDQTITNWVKKMPSVPFSHLVHFREEVLDAVLVLDVVQHDEALPTGGHETGNVPETST